MEPICYLMMLGNFTAGYAFYLKTGMAYDLELTSVHEILTQRLTKRKAKAVGIDMKKHEAQREEMEELEAMLERY